jgi:hypothetical protein
VRSPVAVETRSPTVWWLVCANLFSERTLENTPSLTRVRYAEREGQAKLRQASKGDQDVFQTERMHRSDYDILRLMDSELIQTSF